ncbi:DUF6284 family protein [Streptomyces sp. NPDC091281]|uniref:DUF6284 family protein n=1 Tax=Streptomyces sp. NPDC091281 TaxID=3365985 RepID=UPI00382485E2
MRKITVLDAVTAFADWMEPTDAELDAIEAEMPAILADVEALDDRLTLLEAKPSELDQRRVRRGQNRTLAERTTAANRAGAREVA